MLILELHNGTSAALDSNNAIVDQDEQSLA